jgi:hypothetical protein
MTARPLPPSEDVVQDDDDLPGMLALAKGVAEQKWPHTVDAKVWAEEFCKRLSLAEYEGSDHDQMGTMIAWFANAIMAGYDTAQMRSGAEVKALREALRRFAIQEFGSDAGGGCDCAQCGHQWQSTAAERHAPDCLAALDERERG